MNYTEQDNSQNYTERLSLLLTLLELASLIKQYKVRC